MNKLYLVTGPAGVGKSTVSKLLANKLAKSVLIEGDDIYHMVISSHISPWLPGNHLDLCWDNSIVLINNFLEAGYDVVYNYIIGPDKLELLKQEFSDYEIKFVVLMVDEKTLIKRDKKRPRYCRMGKIAIELLNNFKERWCT